MTRRLRFDLPPSDSRTLRALRWFVPAVLCVWIPLALLSGWRAWVQVRALELRVAADTLRPGDVVGVRVVGSGRNPVDVRLELLQGGRAETIGTHRVPDNGNSATDPRFVRDSFAVRVGEAALRRFVPGPAVLRATATGRSQFLRTPPPTVRERVVVLASDPSSSG